MAPLPSTRRKIPQGIELLSLVFALLVVSLIGGLSYQAWGAFSRGNEQLANIRQVVKSANALLSPLKDAETGQRGFLLTGEDRYLDPYRQALTDIPGSLKALIDATATGNAGQAGAFRL